MILRRQVPVVLQAEINECGLACLSMVLGYHGAGTSLSSLRALNPGGQMLSLDALGRLAHQYHLNTRALRCEPSDLPELALPAILHFDFEHYVLLTQVNSRTVVIHDPARGRIELSISVLGKRFTGIALELMPTAEFRKSPGMENHSPIKLFRKLPLHDIAASLFSLLLISFCVQGFSLVTPFYLQIMVDDVIMTLNQEFALVVALGFAAVYLLSALCQWLRGLLIIHLGNHLSWRLAALLFNHLVHLPSKYFSRRTVGDITSRFSSLSAMQEFLTTSAVKILLDSFMIITTLLVLTAYDVAIAFYLITVISIYLTIQYLLTLPYRRFSHEQIVAEASNQQHFIETVQSMEMIKRYEAELRRQQEWLNRLMIAINARVKAGRVGLLADLARYLLSAALVIGTVLIAVDRINDSLMTIGMLYAMVTYTNHLTTAVLSISECWQRYLMLSLHVQRLSDMFDYPKENKQRLESSGVPQGIEVKNLHYRHPGTMTPLITNMSFSAGADSKIAITGPSGCGKSTLMALLMGQLKPDEGSIALGGRPLGEHLTALPICSTLFQQDQLINATVLDNITLQDPQPNHLKATRAAQVACAYDDIMALPMAWQEQLSESGHRLSAGQRQRILLARVLYRNRGLLLLDEATCHLDDETEIQVMRNILAEPGICIFITHRQEVARLADDIICFGDSRAELSPTARKSHRTSDIYPSSR